MRLNRRSFLAAASAALAALKIAPAKALAGRRDTTPIENFREIQALSAKYDPIGDAQRLRARLLAEEYNAMYMTPEGELRRFMPVATVTSPATPAPGT